MIESSGYCVCDVVKSCCGGVLLFEAVLMFDVWEFVFDVLENSFLRHLDIEESSEIGL